MSSINSSAHNQDFSWDGATGSQQPAIGGPRQPCSNTDIWSSPGQLLPHPHAHMQNLSSQLPLMHSFIAPGVHGTRLRDTNTNGSELPHSAHASLISSQETGAPQQFYNPGSTSRPADAGSAPTSDNGQVISTTSKRPRRRPRAPPVGERQWEQHKTHIEQLYIKEDLPLPKVVEEMEKQSFFASERMYKNKFKAWGWSKNLPIAWMAKKVQQRRPKKTVFECNDEKWTEARLAQRAGKAWRDQPTFCRQEDCRPTPQDIQKYYTPKDDSPQQRGASSQSLGLKNKREDEHLFYLDTPPINLNLQQISISGLHELLGSATSAASAGKVNDANADFRDAVSGFRFKLSPTHEDTLRAAYLYASFYVNCGQMDKADAVLNWMSGHQVTKWGQRHENTYLHYARMIELFRSWGRKDDAELLIYKLLDDETDDVLDIQEMLFESQQQRSYTSIDLVKSFPETDDPDLISQQLNHIDLALMSRIKGLDNVLEVILRHCSAKPDDMRMSLQACRANCALARWHSNAGHVEETQHFLKNARTSILPFLSVSEEPIARTTIETAKNLAYQYFEENDESSCDELIEEVIASLEARCRTFDCDPENDKAFLLDFVLAVAFRFHKIDWDKCRYWVERGFGIAIRMYGLKSQKAREFQKILDKEDFDMRTSTSVHDLMKFSGGFFNIRLVSNPASL